MVVHPQPAGELMDIYPGEVLAREESELAFRIGGKVAKRLVDVGARVKNHSWEYTSHRGLSIKIYLTHEIDLILAEKILG